MIVTAKVISHAFDSKNAIQYWPNDIVDIDLSNPDQRKLVWLRTPRGRWIFEFDRSVASDPAGRIWFCKECGQPFEKVNEIGTHNHQFHNQTKALIENSQAEAEDELEE